MSVTHTNRLGKSYYLHVSRTKTGKPRYFFSLKQDGDLVDAIPEGYEVYEHYEGQVFLRRERPRLITDLEVKLVERELRRRPNTRLSFVQRDQETMTVFVAETAHLAEVQREFAPFADPARVAALLDRFARYTPRLQFQLVDPARRVFQAYRLGFLGRADDWICIGSPDRLDELVPMCLSNVGEESYFDLL